jgi:hypothetical protein
MNCEEFENNVNDLAREQMMEAGVRARALAHRDECEACTRRLQDENALSFGLRTLANETNAQAVPALGNELLIALRSSLRGNQVPIITPINKRWRQWAAAVAVAAMILVVFMVAIMRLRAISAPVPSTAQVPSNPSARPGEMPIAPAPDAVVDGAPASPDNTAENHKTRGKRKTLNRSPVDVQLATRANKNIVPTEMATTDAANSATEITTEFMPVGYANETSMQEGGQLVRVELPRSALIAFGLPMNVNRYDEKVKADVFFGADGMARAIRFVQ